MQFYLHIVRADCVPRRMKRWADLAAIQRVCERCCGFVGMRCSSPQCKRIRAYMTHRESHDHPQTRASLMSKMKITQKCNVCVLRGGWLCFFQHCLPPVWLVSNGSSIRISKNTACVNGFNNLVFCAELLIIANYHAGLWLSFWIIYECMTKWFHLFMKPFMNVSIWLPSRISVGLDL